MFIRQAYLQGKYPVGKLRYTKMVYKNKRLFYATTSTVNVLTFDVLHAIESKPQVIATYSYSYPQTVVLDKNDILWIGFSRVAL